MKQPPSSAMMCAQIEKILRENIDVEGELTHDAALMKDLNFDSLDMIELSFSLEEFFGFEFATKDAFETLDELTDGAILENGEFTERGRQVMLQRAPELASKELPEKLSPMVLQQYYSIETFARLIRAFYVAAPDVCPRTGETVVARDFKLVSEQSSEPVGTLTGDDILDAWAKETAAMLANESA